MEEAEMLANGEVALIEQRPLPRDIGGGTRLLIFFVCLVILGASVMFSKRGSIAEGKAT
jgi:hypothetical protein